MTRSSSNSSVRSAPGTPSFRDLLAFWPDTRSISDDLHCSYFTVAAWIRRGFIPSGRWEELVAAARDRGLHGVTIPQLRAAQAAYEGRLARPVTISTPPLIVQGGETANARNEVTAANERAHVMPLDTAGSNSASNDSAADWMRQYRTQKRLCDEANGVLRSLVKRAKADGMNTSSMIAAVKATKLEPDVVQTDLRDQLRYMSIIHIPLKKEVLFDWSDVVTEKTAHEDELWEANDRGYRDGRHGTKVEDAPYEPGTEMHVHWIASWHKGQAAIATELGPDVQVVAASRKRPARGEPSLQLVDNQEEDADAPPPKAARKPRGSYAPRGAGGRKRNSGGAVAAN